MEGVYTIWLSELGTFEIFRDLNYSYITGTDVLWHDLHEYVCYYSWDLSISSLLLPWLCLHCIMKYPLCMTHDFATANHYDHAWTAKWAQNICKLSMLMSPMQLRCDGRQHGRRGRLYATKVKWNIYPTGCALLDVGFMFVLKRTDIFILICACTAVLPNVTTVIFQIIHALKQNYCVVLDFAAMLSRCCSRNDAYEAVW